MRLQSAFTDGGFRVRIGPGGRKFVSCLGEGCSLMSLMVTTGEQILDTVVGAEVPTGVNLTTSLLAGPEV